MLFNPLSQHTRCARACQQKSGEETHQQGRDKIDPLAAVLKPMGLSNLGHRTSRRCFGLLMGVGIAGGCSIALWPSGSVVAQAFGDPEIERYARAVLSIEPLRRAAGAEMQAFLGQAQLPPVLCADATTVTSLSDLAREVATNYCNQGKRIIQETGLTVEQFNQITEAHRNDPALTQRIQTVLLELQ